MATAVCEIELYIPAAGSLKAKRQVVKSVMDRLRVRCAASVAETGHQEVWQRATITLAMAGSSRAVLEKQVALARRIADDTGEAEVASFMVDFV